MKILMTIHHRLEHSAGAPGVTLRLAEEFRQLGHETTVLSFDDLQLRRPERAQALMFPYLVARRVNRPADRWDVLDASSGDAWFYASVARQRRDRPLIVFRSHGLEHTAHERLVQEARRGAVKLSWKYPLYHGGFRLWEVTRSLRSADIVLLLNAADGAYVGRHLAVPSHKVRIVRNGVPESFLGQALQIASPGTNQSITIAQVGSYRAMKGIAYGSKALSNILRRHPHLRVRFLGTLAPAELVLRDFHADVRERIAVIPRFAHDELPALLAGCQIKFFPTLSEGFGLALVEAMACGLAPVTTATPGPSMIVVDGENGLLVPPADSAALEAALERLITDPALLAKLRKRALMDAQGYSWRRVAQEQLALYEEFRDARGKRHLR